MGPTISAARGHGYAQAIDGPLRQKSAQPTEFGGPCFLVFGRAQDDHRDEARLVDREREPPERLERLLEPRAPLLDRPPRELLPPRAPLVVLLRVPPRPAPPLELPRPVPVRLVLPPLEPPRAVLVRLELRPTRLVRPPLVRLEDLDAVRPPREPERPDEPLELEPDEIRPPRPPRVVPRSDPPSELRSCDSNWSIVAPSSSGV